MYECSCSIDSLDGDCYEDVEQRIFIKENKSTQKCCECGRKILIGEEFEWYKGRYDGHFYTHYTCQDCLSLRNSFFSSWMFENLWESFRDNMEDCGWQVPEKCLAKLTLAAREKVCQMIEESWEDEQWNTY